MTLIRRQYTPMFEVPELEVFRRYGAISSMATTQGDHRRQV